MLTLTWIVFALLALLWTGGAWLTAAAAGWLAQASALPSWVNPWIDPVWFEPLQGIVSAAAGWAVPLVWITWGIGFALLLAGTAAVHFGLRRFGRRRFAPA